MENKKKVGIITFHAANNYGAVLQCYALQQMLKSMNYETCVVDYRLPMMVNLYKSIDVGLLRKSLLSFDIKDVFLRICSFAGYYLKKRYVKTRRFNQFRTKYLACTKPCNQDSIPQDIDTFVIGSDQVWNIGYFGEKLDDVYFGNFKHSDESKIYGYAISANIRSINSIGADNLRKFATNFEVVSFREESIQNRVTELSGVSSRIDIDPTLLLDEPMYDELIDDKWATERYVLCYILTRTGSREDRAKDRAKIISKAKKIAKELDCKVITISGDLGPTDFVSLFKYAQYVVTSSFHGTAFSLIFKKPLCCVVMNDGFDVRYVDLLTNIGAEKMLVDINEDVSVQTFDYKLIYKSISKIRDSSLTYLRGL